MKPKLRRHLSGTFVAQNLSTGCWRLSQGNPPQIEIFLMGVESAALGLLHGADVSDLAIEWRCEEVLVHTTAGGEARACAARSAIIHEPLAHLYGALPLAAYEANAQRFWRRVFFLSRIPGGRALLRLLSRHTRGGQSVRDEPHKTP